MRLDIKLDKDLLVVPVYMDREGIADLWVKTLLTTVGSDLLDKEYGGSLLGSGDIESVRMAVDDTTQQVKSILIKNASYYGYSNDFITAEISNIAMTNDTLYLEVVLVFGSNDKIIRVIEISSSEE
jgi:hypothetical protein